MLQIAVIINIEICFPFYSLLVSGCVLMSYSMLSLIIAWLGYDYSSEAETADKETAILCSIAASDVMTNDNVQI